MIMRPQNVISLVLDQMDGDQTSENMFFFYLGEFNFEVTGMIDWLKTRGI